MKRGKLFLTTTFFVLQRKGKVTADTTVNTKLGRNNIWISILAQKLKSCLVRLIIRYRYCIFRFFWVNRILFGLTPLKCVFIIDEVFIFLSVFLWVFLNNIYLLWLFELMTCNAVACSTMYERWIVWGCSQKRKIA